MTSAIVAPTYLSAGQNPVAVYLTSLSSERSRRTMLHALRSVIATTKDVKAEDIPDAEAFSFPWHELRYQHTQAIRSKLQANYSYSTVNLILSALRRVLKECWRLGYVDMETMGRACDIDNVKGETLPAGRDMAQGEIIALVDACKRDSNKPGGYRDAAILGLLYGCGIRRAELAALDLSDFDPSSGSIKIRHGKGNKERLTDATNGTLTALLNWIVIRGNEPGALFLPVKRGGGVVREYERETKQNGIKIIDRRPDGQLLGIAAQTIYDMLKRRKDQAQVKDFSPHDFRRTYVGELLDRGVDIATVANMTGHSSVETTRRYDRRPAATRRAAAQKLHFPYSGWELPGE